MSLVNKVLLPVPPFHSTPVVRRLSELKWLLRYAGGTSRAREPRQHLLRQLGAAVLASGPRPQGSHLCRSRGGRRGGARRAGDCGARAAAGRHGQGSAAPRAVA